MSVYYEIRKPQSGARTVTYDLAAHLEARQHTEKAIVLCDNPSITISSVRKHWHKLTRVVQRQRSSTLNADKILRYTHAISRMQFTRFSSKPPLAQPDAQAYFLRPQNLTELPLDCFTVYILTETPATILAQLPGWLPENALIVDYTGQAGLDKLGLVPKRKLEQAVLKEWSGVSAFFEQRHVDLAHIAMHNPSAQDDALDSVLGSYNRFLRLAEGLQRAIDLAQPATFSHAQKRQFELCAMIAYRVQSLTRNTQNTASALNFLDDHAFFLHDPAAQAAGPLDLLAQEVARHKAAGRERLAKALQQSYGLRLLGT